MEDLMSLAKITKFIERQKEEEKNTKIIWIFAIIGAILVIAIIARFAYQYFAPDYIDEFDDDFEDEFEDDFFDDEDEEDVDAAFAEN